MKLHGAIFDMDGTLLDSMSIWMDLAESGLRAHGIEPPPDLFARVTAETMTGAIRLLQKTYLPEVPFETLLSETSARVAEFYRTEAQIKPHVADYLWALHARGVPCYLATATDRPFAEPALRRFGIDGCFIGLLTAEEAGHGKQYPDIYLSAAASLGLPPREIAVFEDSPSALRTAKGAGFFTVGVYDRLADAMQSAVRAASDLYLLDLSDPKALEIF